MKSYIAMLVLVLSTGCAKNELPGPSNPEPGFRRQFSQGEVGNAGHGYFKNGKLYLIDLVEAGAEETKPLTADGFDKKNRLILNLIRPEVLKVHPIFTSDEFCAKMSQILYIDPIFGRSLIEAINMYEWLSLDSYFRKLELKKQILDVKDEDVIMVASRVGKKITLSLPAINKMNEVNQVATIVHEMVSALITPQAVDGDGRVFEQNGVRARQIVGKVFGPEFNGKIAHAGISTVMDKNEIPFFGGGVDIGSHPTTVESAFLGRKSENPTIIMDFDLQGRLKDGTQKYAIYSRGERFAAHSVNRKAITELCRDSASEKKAIELVLVSNERNLVVGPTGITLAFDTFRDTSEEKTYVKYTRVGLTTLSKELETSTLNQEDCEIKVRNELWKSAVSVFGEKSFAKEAEEDAVLNRYLETLGR